MMYKDDILISLTSCWDYDNGFFGKLRQGVFDNILFEKTVGILEGISEEDEWCDKEVIPLLWIIPLFLEWQKERVLENLDSMSSDDYSKKCVVLENEVIRILGMP